MGTWSIFTTIMAKKAKQVEGFISGAKPPEPVDRNLPLGLYVGATVDLDATPFILGGAALKIKLPGERNTVEAFGRINFARQHPLPVLSQVHARRPGIHAASGGE